MLGTVVSNRLMGWMKYLEQQNLTIFYTPFYEVKTFRKDSFNARHCESLFSIEPRDVIAEHFTRIVKQFELNEEYICGFRRELRPVADDEFVAEMLLPDYSFLNTRRGVTPDDCLSDSIHRRFNGPMVMDCIKYAREVLCEDMNDPEFTRILLAPCFLGCVAEIWEVGLPYEEMVDKAYLSDMVARSD